MTNKKIKIESTISHIILAVLIVFCLLAVFFSVKWTFAQSIASSAQEIEVAEIAAAMDSGNPQTHYSIAVLQENSFLPDDIPKSLARFEKATSLSPNDYRLWLALGKARERSGDFRGAELAFQKASSLAPNYSQVQWAYGNSLLRQGKNKEAFVQIGKAVESDETLANPAVNAAWMVLEGNVDKIKEVIGDSNYTRAALVMFLLKENKTDEALAIWKSIPLKERVEKFETEGGAIFGNLIEAKKYRLALQLKSQIIPKSAEKLSLGKINNEGFEENIKEAGAAFFEWQLGSETQPQIGIDDKQKRGGDRSLALVFSGRDQRTFRGISQTIIVEGGKQYQLRFFYKADLELAPVFKWEVVDTNEGGVIASTEPLSKNTDWTTVNLSFTPPENTEAFILRLVRSECSSELCPTSGRLWFDDFSLN